MMAAATTAATAATTTKAKTTESAHRGHPRPVTGERDTRCAGPAGRPSRTSTTGSCSAGGCHRRSPACHHPAGGRPRCQRLLASIHQLALVVSIVRYPNYLRTAQTAGGGCPAAIATRRYPGHPAQLAAGRRASHQRIGSATSGPDLALALRRNRPLTGCRCPPVGGGNRPGGHRQDITKEPSG